MSPEGIHVTAPQVQAHLEGHEELCAERMSNLNARFDKMERVLGWFLGVIAIALLGVIGWGIEQGLAAGKSSLDSERSQAQAQQAQIALMQSQMATISAALKPQSVVVNQPTGQAALTTTTNSTP
jgi:hypothetical protein